MSKQVFGTDVDIPLGTSEVDILDKVRNLVPYLDSVESLRLVLLGNLEMKPAFRIRLMGIYEDGETPTK